MALLPIVAGGPGDQFSDTSNIQGHPLGGRMIFADGREFAYGQAAATAITAGKLCAQTINNANFDELVVPTAAAVGDKAVEITTGSVAITVDQAKDGYLNIEDDAGEGHLYTIKSHPAIATTSNGFITLYDSIQVAITVATTVTFYLNPHSAVIIQPGPPVTAILGVTSTARTASFFGWPQTKGPASLLQDQTPIIAEQTRASDALAGAVEALDRDGTNENEVAVGIAVEVAASGEHGIVHLQLS